MTTMDKIRESVSKTYNKAVRGSGRCCVPTCCDDAVAIPKGEAAKVAGYGDEELGSLPADAVENAFGCGNPLAFTGVQEGDVVVDLGSGAGIDLLLASKRVGSSGKVIGVDMTAEMIARARAAMEEIKGYDQAQVDRLAQALGWACGGSERVGRPGHAGGVAARGGHSSSPLRLARLGR